MTQVFFYMQLCVFAPLIFLRIEFDYAIQAPIYLAVKHVNEVLSSLLIRKNLNQPPPQKGQVDPMSPTPPQDQNMQASACKTSPCSRWEVVSCIYAFVHLSALVMLIFSSPSHHHFDS